MTAGWKIRIGKNARQVVYIWNTSAEYVPLQAVWKWDGEGTIWSTGNSSARRLCSILSYIPNEWSTQAFKDEGYTRWWEFNTHDSDEDKQIYWVTRWADENGYLQDYPASKITDREDSAGAPLHNIIQHIAHVEIEFNPAAPYFNSFVIDGYVADYLNYFYMDFQTSPLDPIVSPKEYHPDFPKIIDWKGKWLLWHSGRLEEEEEWDVPEDAYDGNFSRVAVTALNAMPCQGRYAPRTPVLEGNIDKGRGMASTFGGTDYTPRGPISFPMFLGPGTIKIANIFYDRILIGLNGRHEIKIETRPTEVITRETRYTASIPVSIPVQSILKNFEDAHTWPAEEWEQHPGLISERAHNTAGEYYEGQIIPRVAATYVVNKITINEDWLAEAKEAGTKCAIVFVMAYGDEEISLDHFVSVYSGSTIPSMNNFTLEVVVDKENVEDTLMGDISKGIPAFTFKPNYQYIIDPDDAEGDPPEMVFNSHDFTAKIQWKDMYYQLAAMIYRVVPVVDSLHEVVYYKIDTDFPYPIEYWYGITTPIDPTAQQKTYRRLESNEQYTQEEEIGIIASAVLPSSVTNTTHVKVTVTVPSGTDERDIPPEDSYIRFYLHDVDTGEDIWNDTKIRLPNAAEGFVSREILFLTRKYAADKTYQIYRQAYNSFGVKIGDPRAVGKYHTVTREYLIDSLAMAVTADPVTIEMSDLEMLYAPKDASYYYRFTIRSVDVTPEQTYTEDREDPCHPSKFSWDVQPTFTELTDSTTYELTLYIYSDAARIKPLASYSRRYATQHYITSFTAVDVFAREHPDDPQFLDHDKVKVQFKFHAKTTLDPSDSTYGFKVSLYKYNDVPTPADTEPEEEPDPVKVWDLTPSSPDEFEVITENPIELDSDPGTYRLGLQLIVKATGATREKYYTSWETPMQMASGWITGGDKRIRISTPSDAPDETRIEYRMLRDGVLGTVESPWEMRTESVIGGNTVTQPAWIVRPRMVQFRIMVTAPITQMPKALRDLNEVLVSAPTKGVELKLQTTDRLRQLSIFGYIQVGSPKIEIREDTVSIVSVVLDCPNYAWRGHTEMMPLVGERTVELTPLGHLPPAVDIWIWNSHRDKNHIELAINDNEPLKINTESSDSSYIHLHHDPIVQDYYIELAVSLPPAFPTTTNTSRPCILRSYPPLSAHSILLGDEETSITETQRQFDLIEPGSYLPIMLNPSRLNTIKVTGGRLALIEYRPHYAFWW